MRGQLAHEGGVVVAGPARPRAGDRARLHRFAAHLDQPLRR
jgi:hypothetical protein